MGRIAQMLGVAVLAAPFACPAAAEEVGKIGVDWAGNDIVIEAIADPKVTGVTCHLAYFRRGIIDRLANGNWFEDPSNSAIECQQTGPIKLGDIDRSNDGEDVFRASRSIILKSLRVKRIYDEANRTLIYVAHARELTQGSAKVSISTVPIGDAVN
jgi:CreA protein